MHKQLGGGWFHIEDFPSDELEEFSVEMNGDCEVSLGTGVWKPLSRRAIRVLDRAEITAPDQLREEISSNRLMRIRGCGPKTLSELKVFVYEIAHERDGLAMGNLI
jgi:hypothetical protein